MVGLGSVNYIHGYVHGLQFSVINVGLDKTDGAQAAVFLNVSDEAVNGLEG